MDDLPNDRQSHLHRLKRPITRSSAARLRKSSPGNSLLEDASSSSSAAKQRRGVAKPERLEFSSSPPSSSAFSTNMGPGSSSGSNNGATLCAALTCVLCRDIFREPYSLPCGHSFCHECIFQALSFAAKCPVCDKEIRNPDLEVHPNFSLGSVVDRYALVSQTVRGGGNLLAVDSTEPTSLLHNVPEPHNSSAHTDEHDLDVVALDASMTAGTSGGASSVRRLSLLSSSSMPTAAEIDREINRLKSMKAQIELQDEYLENVLVREFLSNVKASIEQQIAKFRSKLDKVTGDLDEVSACLRCVVNGNEQLSASTQTSSALATTSLTPSARVAIRSMSTHFSDFEELYDRSSPSFSPTFDEPAVNSRRIASFRRALVQGTRYSGLRPIASIDFAMGTLQRTSCIVSSVAFNSRRDLFALAGVTKEIKVYDYTNAVNSSTSACPLVYPVTRMQNEKNKVSCISWSPFHAGQLGSTDYDGYVVVWDALRSTITTQWNEHDKRCWTIDFNKAEPDMLATGSDDFKVKIWKLNCEHSVNQIEWARSNVCAVDFHPTSRYHIVFGASDHNLYYFDLRQVRSPVAVMRGHTKAVSYARFLSPNEICSASIDGTLRLWDVSGRSCVRSYSGHTNEMNFVGLDTYSNYIVCGSETNEVFVYYKYLRRPLFTYKFPSEPSLPEPPNSFVSALAWNKSAGVLLAANSQGYAKLLEFETPS